MGNQESSQTRKRSREEEQKRSPTRKRTHRHAKRPRRANSTEDADLDAASYSNFPPNCVQKIVQHLCSDPAALSAAAQVNKAFRTAVKALKKKATSNKPRLANVWRSREGVSDPTAEEFDEALLKRVHLKALQIDVGQQPIPRPLADVLGKLKALRSLRLDLVVRAPLSVEHATLTSLKVVVVGLDYSGSARPRVAIKCPQVSLLKFFGAEGVDVWPFADEVRQWGDGCPKVTALHLAGAHAGPPPAMAFTVADVRAAFEKTITQLTIPATAAGAERATSLLPNLRFFRAAPSAACSAEAPGRAAVIPAARSPPAIAGPAGRRRRRSTSLQVLSLSGWTRDADGWRSLLRTLLDGRFPALAELRLEDIQAYCTGAGGWPSAPLDLRLVKGATVVSVRHGEVVLRSFSVGALAAALRTTPELSPAPPSAADVLSLAAGAGATLEVLKLGPPLNCEDEALAKAVAAARALKRLEIERMPAQTPAGFVQLLSKLPKLCGQLQRVKIVGRAAGTDEGRAALAALRSVALALPHCSVKYNGSRVYP